MGELQAVTPAFQPVIDLSYGGVLLALPALLACGLLKDIANYFQLPKGYYGLESIILLLAFMALARIKTIEDLRYCAPGEWGKLLGLDRIPEVRTLRNKLKQLANTGQTQEWGAKLCADWMQSDSEAAATLYIDGHVRVYHGHQTKLPRHYVSREKLCLRATVDYWVNAMDSQPFFVVNKAVDPGLLAVLEGEIVPRLEQDVPTQWTEEALDADPHLHNFTVIFDREGYSPDFMKRMKAKRIACITYHKHPTEDWPATEFTSHEVRMLAGNLVSIKLAERGTRLKNGLWVREVRKLTESGHQTSILSTDYRSDLRVVASKMGARWSQENFFKYMREHYNLDRLSDYSLEEIPDTTKVVNPDYRRIDGDVRRHNAKLSRLLAEFGAIHLEGDIEPKRVEEYQKAKAALQDDILRVQAQLDTAKEERKKVERHIPLGKLPDEQKFAKLSTKTKHVVDVTSLTI